MRVWRARRCRRLFSRGRRSRPRPEALTSSRPDGKYEVTGLPPGNYFIAAGEEALPGQWSEPVFLQRLVAGAVRVTLAEGEQKTLDVKIK